MKVGVTLCCAVMFATKEVARNSPLLHGSVRVVDGDPLRRGQAEPDLLLRRQVQLVRLHRLAAALLPHLQQQRQRFRPGAQLPESLNGEQQLQCK